MGDDPLIANSLGGSLMKDLFEDLALGDDDFLSLDQLEKELQEMENTSTINNFEAQVPLTAAGLIVQQQNMNSMSLFGGVPSSFSPSGAAAPTLNSLLFAGGGSSQPPPFLATTIGDDNPVKTLDAWSLSLQNFSGTSLLQEDFLQADSARKQEQQTYTPPGPPPGLQNLPEYDISAPPPPGMRVQPAVPHPDLVQQAAERLAAQVQANSVVSSPEYLGSSSPARLTPMILKRSVPTTPQMAPWGGKNKLPPPPPPTPYTTPQSSVGVAVAPLPVVPPAQRPRIYANPHPTAEPVLATNIPSKYMTARDLCYVVHSILKPILTQNAEESSTYHLEYWMRHHPAAPMVLSEPKGAGNLQELASRSAKATEWSKENKVLGTTSKSAVTRPRALIAVVAPADDEENEKSKNQHRAALWKARVRCDQGYACFTQLQYSAAARIKLLKCFGVQNGNLDVSILQGILKLAKGRTLLARTLEMYPEVIPMFLLPATITILAGGDVSGGGTTTTTTTTPITDNRLCAAWARVIASASNEMVLAQEPLFISCIQIVVERGTLVLHDTSHMMIAHALLQRAGAAAATNVAFANVYAPLEARFMELLSTV